MDKRRNRVLIGIFEREGKKKKLNELSVLYCLSVLADTKKEKRKEKKENCGISDVGSLRPLDSLCKSEEERERERERIGRWKWRLWILAFEL